MRICLSRFIKLIIEYFEYFLFLWVFFKLGNGMAAGGDYIGDPHVRRTSGNESYVLLIVFGSIDLALLKY